jgi:hypothetical protein
MARLNDTAAIVAQPGGEMEHTIRTRKIGNGYLVSKSSYNSHTGDYECVEEYSDKAPNIELPRIGNSGDAAGYSGLGDTKKYLSGN